MANGVNIFNSAVREKDSEFHIVFRLLADGSIDDSLPPVAILWVKALEPFFPTRHALFWIETIDPIPLIGQMQGIPSRHLPDPTSGVREPLCFIEVHLTLLQGLIERAQSG